MSRLCIAVCLIVYAVSAISCDRGDGSTATSTATVAPGTPASTATPTPPPPDPTLADELRYEGDFEGAAAVYGAIAAEATAEEQWQAQLAQAQMLLRAGLASEARAPLQAHVAGLAASAAGTTGQFLLASTLDDVGEDVTATDLYGAYITAGGALDSYARIERAKLLAAQGRGAEAEAEALIVTQAPEVADLLGSFALSMGRAYRAAGLSAEATAWLERVAAYDGDAASAVYTLGEIKREAVDLTWTDDYRALLAAYPEGALAGDVLAALDEAAVPVGPYLRGLVAYRAFDNETARTYLTEAVAVGDSPGEAAYYLGALAEREGDDAAAAEEYGRSVAIDPTNTLAASALWWRGRILEHSGQYDAAAQAYAQLETDYPGSARAGEAAFHRGLALYRAGDLAGAAGVWAAIAPQQDSEGYRARLWQGRALREMDDPLGEAVLRLLADDEAAQGDYYALRARVLLGDEIGQDDPDQNDSDAPDWDAIAAAVLPTATPPGGSEDAAPVAAPASLDEADELEAVGLRGQADRVRSEAVSDAATDPEALLAITRRFYDDGDESYAARAATALLAHLDESALEGGKRELARVAYAQPYREMVAEAADEHDLDVLLLYALMRQESLYDPDAGSVAGALGLMQVIPPTGETIAGELEVEGFEAADLFRPAVSIRFGAYYLAAQIEAFDGEVAHALAAYNGGPGAADDGRAAAPDDIDMFVESLEFEETRLYVRRVMEHYAQYRFVYEGLEEPALPE
jgi:soluble lytic murein transglycosylase